MSDGLFRTGIAALAPEAQKAWVEKATSELLRERDALAAENERLRKAARRAYRETEWEKDDFADGGLAWQLHEALAGAAE